MAAVAGAGAAWWHSDEQSKRPDVWSLRFPKPGGGEVALSEWRGAPLLINFWATWCPPCVEEMPLLARFQKAQRGAGWRVLGLAVDKEKPVQEFVAAKGIDFPIALAGNEGLALSRSLGNTAGGLPFSLALGRNGTVLAQKVGALNEAMLAEWARLQA
ncbi:MAG: TlpA disulfide reductase family protein [Caldimonas sp.]